MALVIIYSLLFLVLPAHAEDTLPYTVRTHGYTGWSGAVRGETRTIGMSGATVGLADSYLAAIDNPAGLTMTPLHTGIQASGNRIQDGFVQNYGEVITTSAAGASFTEYPWGVGGGYWTPNSEGMVYLQPDSGVKLFPELEVKEYRLSVSRLFFDNRFALGSSLIVGRAVERLGLPDSPELGEELTIYSLGVSFGAMAQLPGRWILGSSFTTPMRYPVVTEEYPTDGITGFFQPVHSPHRFGLGLGWIPNRFFRGGMSLLLIGGVDNAALISNDSNIIGRKPTLQPRLGFSYLFADFKEFRAYLNAGSYFEVSRIPGQPDRLHGTATMEIKPWIFSIGWGIDEAARYHNLIYSVGIDAIRVMRKLDLIPRKWNPPLGGWFPDPTLLSDEDLPRPLVQEWKQREFEKDIFEIGAELPGKVQDKLLSAPEDLQDFIKTMSDTVTDEIQTIAPE